MQSEPRSARTSVWALPRSLAATYGITCCFLFLRLLRCFSSPGSLRMTMDSSYGDWPSTSRVPPFRYPWIIAYVQLPKAFRSLSRLSSALSAKASALRPFLLNLFIFGSLVLSIPGIALPDMDSCFYHNHLSATMYLSCLESYILFRVCFRCLLYCIRFSRYQSQIAAQSALKATT